MTLKLKVTFAAITLCLLGFNVANAQNKTAADSLQSGKPDTLASAVHKLQSAMKLLDRLKISGYAQAQFQTIQTAGAASFAGGNFGPGIDNRFMLRRGRLKVAYTGPKLSQYVMEFDVNEKGVSIKDMYAKFYDPWIQAFSITGGVFYRPFGDEVSLSSSKRESPEESRIIQTLFPGERDLGAQLSIQGPKGSSWNFLKMDLGLFNGNGPNPETDSKKDFIGHITVNKANKSESFKYGLGLSYYNGGVLQSNDVVYSMSTSGGVPSYTAASVSSPGSLQGKFAKREYTGVDGQFTATSGIGSTTLRGEYVLGDQPGSASSSVSPQAITTGDTYLRKFKGAYVNVIQDFKSVPIALIAKYDWYDPNTKVSGNAISSANKFTGADIKYQTLGLGLIYKYDANVNLTAYYDRVKNETTSQLAGFSKDLKDNVMTLRIQYKF